MTWVSRLFDHRVPLLLGLVLSMTCTSPVGPADEALWLAEDERETVDLSGTLKTLDGKDVSLADLQQEKVLFLNLWATWCGPCRAEMPSMSSLYETLAGKGLAMVAVSDEDIGSVREYLQEFAFPFTILLDPESILGQRFEVYAIPTTLVIDTQGRLVLRHTGAHQWDSPQMIEQFRRLVVEQ